MMGGGTMPASMGMMMLGRLIMHLVGDRDSWDQRSLMMGDDGRHGRWHGWHGRRHDGWHGRRLPLRASHGLPETALKPHQVRHLPTAVVSLNGPDEDGRPVVPTKDEPLKISAIEQWTDDMRTRTALKRLAEVELPREC